MSEWKQDPAHISQSKQYIGSHCSQQIYADLGGSPNMQRCESETLPHYCSRKAYCPFFFLHCEIANIYLQCIIQHDTKD